MRGTFFRGGLPAWRKQVSRIGSDGTSNERGDYFGALRHWERVSEVRQQSLGAEHPDTLMSVSNLASVYESLGRYGDAERLYLRELPASERVLGAEHPDTLRSAASLAALFGRQGPVSGTPSGYLSACWQRWSGCWGLNIRTH